MRKIFLPLFILPVLLVAACGDSSSQDSAEQQKQVRAVQGKLLAAVKKGDNKAYCALTINPAQSSKAWQKTCVSRNPVAKYRKSIGQQIAALAGAKIVVGNGQATVFLPVSGPQQFQLAGDRWLLNVAPNAGQQAERQIQTQVRDRTRFYLATLINKDAAAYCVVGIQKGESQKECVSRAKGWFGDKKSDYKQQLDLAKKQIKSIDKAKIQIDGKQATVETDPDSIKLSATGPGNSWVVVRG